MNLSDAIGHFRAIADTTHKFWGYFQAVAAGTTAFAWAGDSPRSLPLLAVLTIAFVVFAIGNGRLVVSSQAAAVETAGAIKTYSRNHPTAIPTEFLPLIDKLNPDPVFWVGLCHVGISVAVVVAVWIRGFLGI